MSALVKGADISKATEEKTAMENEKGIHEELDQTPASSAKVSNDYIECKEEDLIYYSDEERQVFYKEAIVKFNVKPKSAREYLILKKMIQVCFGEVLITAPLINI
jgi:hypothetical protein